MSDEFYFRSIKRVIIAGSRDVTARQAWPAIDIEMDTVYPDCTTVLCGEAKGVDMLGAEWAIDKGLAVEYYPALWEAEGKAAGFIRNRRMAENADGLLVIWDGVSKGTRNMIKEAANMAIEMRVVYV